jgi:methylthioribose-1-phosphate isomerase
MRTVDWDESQGELKLIDQRQLPGRLVLQSYRDDAGVAQAIREMVVRGAPAIGVTAAFGMVLAIYHQSGLNVAAQRQRLAEAAVTLRGARPTAVNLSWAVERMLGVAQVYRGDTEGLRARLLQAALAMAEEDVRTNLRMAEVGAGLIEDGDTIIHHCNTGALAAVDWGTALGCIRMAHQQGKHVHVLVDETRPRLQGARLTAWELQQYGVPFEIISDGAAGFFLRRGEAQKVMFGADRVAANGDVANKIGTYMLSLAAQANGAPVYAVMPTSTIDLNLADGDAISIEEREPGEVLDIQVHGEPVPPVGAQARNPAFDVTPHQLISALVTEKGVVRPPYSRNLSALMGAS